MRALIAFVLMISLSGCMTGSERPDDPLPPEAGARYDPGWPDPDAAPLRPGAKLFASLEDQTTKGQRMQCTLNFIFGDMDNSTLYVGTASHCVSGFTVGDPIVLADGAAAGTLVYCSFAVIHDTEPCPDLGAMATAAGANDFALIQIDAADRDKVHPALFEVGGPTGLAEPPAQGTLAYTYGNSDFRDARLPAAPVVLDARAGRVWHAGDWIVEVVFDVTSVGGDSGSPVVDGDGRALGVLQYVLSDACPGPRPDVNGVVYLPAALAYLHEHTDLRVELKTWPLMRPPALLPEAPWPCSDRHV